MSQSGPRPIIFDPPQLPTPPGSPTRAPPGLVENRRKHLRESEDNSGELSLERFLYRTDPYRSSSLRTPYPCPMRVHTIVPETSHPLHRDSELTQIIRRILGEHRIEFQDFFFCGQSKPDYTGDAKIKTLRVQVDVDENVSTTSWSKARRALSQMLHERGFPTIEVEILDPARINVFSIFPIAPEHPVISIYESFRERIIQELIRSLGQDWTSLCLFSIGPTSENTRFAVVITVRPFIIHDWHLLRITLLGIIKLEFEAQKISQPASSIDIEFAAGGWNARNPPNETPGRAFISDLSEHPKLGTSIGVEGEREGGTLGGFFRLKCGEQVHRGFLTNYHVVQPRSTAPQSVKDSANEDGTSYRPDFIDDKTKSSVHFFALKDIEASKESNELVISGDEEKIKEKTDKQMQRQQCYMDPDDRLERQKVKYEESKKVAEGKREKLQQLPLVLGKVLVSSGRAFNPDRHIVDWAFVEMLPSPENRNFWSSPSKNQLPHEAAAGIYLHLPNDHAPGLSSYLPGNPPESIQGFSELQKGQWYFKVGRTTAITTGICHGTKVILRTPGTEEITMARTQYGETGRSHKLSEPVKYVEEHIILNSKHGKGLHMQEDFCQSGDSGALLIDSEGCAAGLLYASYSGCTSPFDNKFNSEGWYVAAGIAMTMPDILESIGIKTTPRDASGNPTGPPGQLLLP